MGSAIENVSKSWGLTVSQFHRSSYFMHNGVTFIIVLLVIDDIEFSSNCKGKLDDFKTKLKQTLDLKCFGNLYKVIGWSMNFNDAGIPIHQNITPKHV